MKLYYSAVGIVAALVLVIVNHDVLFKQNEAFKLPTWIAYKRFLFSVFVYYATDILWGVFQGLKMPLPFFIITSLNYIAMSVGIWFWIGYIVTYYSKKLKVLKTVFLNLGRGFTALVSVLVIINIFKPILFTISNSGEYSVSGNRFLVSVSQTLILLFLLLHSLSLVFVRHSLKKNRYAASFLLIMIVLAFIVSQVLYSELPYYSIAYLLGSCLLHAFVIDDEKKIFKRETQEAAKQEIITASATYENIIRILSKDYFNLYYVDLETDEYIEYGSRTDLNNSFVENRGKNFFKTIGKNVNELVYEEDRENLIQALNRENILNELEKNGSFGYYYRLMINGEPIYVALKATQVKNDSHYIIIGVNNVDSQMKDRIDAESAKEERKAYLRLNAFSSNLLAFYIVDPETDEYTQFSASSNFEKLGIAKKGKNFFEETYQNGLKVIYKEDLESFNKLFTKRNIIGAIKIDGIFIMEYRLMLNGTPTYSRLKASEIEEDGKKLLVIGIENVDKYVRREKKQALELSAAKELATKDALTGVRNSYAFSQEKAVLNQQIEKQQASEFAVVVCDINNLKTVNDTLGHTAGDELIRKACNRICNIFKHSSVFRVGGDEFAVICQGQDYDNLADLIAKMNFANSSQSDVQIAFGMTRYCLGQSVEEVLESADKLMYEHKAKMKKLNSFANKATSSSTAKYEFPEDLKKAYENSPLSFVYYQNINDRAVPILASEGFCRNTGMPREAVMDWLSNGMFERMHPDDVGVVSQISDDFLHQRGEYDTIFRCRIPSPDGNSENKKEQYIYIHGIGKWQTMPDGTPLAVITYGNLSTAQKSTAEQLENYLNVRRDYFYTDSLTGLPNFNYVQEFGEEKAKVIRASGNTPHVFYIDIISMQSYNNQYGFKEGDNLIALAAKTLNKQFSKSLVVRDTADHFIIISEIDEPEKIEKQLYRANRIIRIKAHGNTSGVRCGVCPMEETTTLAEAIDHAKMALKYIENDMNREVSFFNKSSNLIYLHDRYIIENLDKALRNGWIGGYYHAIHRVESRKIAAFEYLARWNDPERGLISPSDFIPVLVKYHLLHKLDLFMFEQVCKEVPIRFENNLPLVPVSVNFSRQDFDHIDICAEMNRLFDKYQMSKYVDKSYFVVEITEQDLEEGEEIFREQLEKIRESGFTIWLDDFGSGYSAISSFSQYQFDLIKFDMNLVKHLDDQRGINHILLEELVSLAKKLGIHTLIEGCETEEHLEFIKKIGCELVQGYYYHKPESLDDILKRIKSTGFIKSCETSEEREDFNSKWLNNSK